MRDERERKERGWGRTQRGVIGLALLTLAGCVVWFLRPPRVEVGFVVSALDGSTPVVRLGGRPLGITPQVLDLERLRAASVGEPDPAVRELRASGARSLWQWDGGIGTGGRVEAELFPTRAGERMWLHLELEGTAHDEVLWVPITCGPSGTLLELRHESSWRPFGVRVRKCGTFVFRAP